MKQTLSMVTLGVADLARSLAFYEGVLGWRRSPESQEGSVAFFGLGGFFLGLYPREALAEDAKVSAAGDGFNAFALAHNVGSEAEVDAVFAMVEERGGGGTVIKPPEKVFWGGYSGYIADPDGHLIEVAHNPFWKLDERGHVAEAAE